MCAILVSDPVVFAHRDNARRHCVVRGGELGEGTTFAHDLRRGRWRQAAAAWL
jgi:hypothetical protein